MNSNKPAHTEVRYVVIYGYTQSDLQKLMKHFQSQLPDNITLTFSTQAECTHIKLTGSDSGLELLRFNMNKYQQTLASLFSEELLSLEDKSISQVLGEKLLENNLTVATAESCTGGTIASRIVQTVGSSAYFLGSVVSYSNEVKASVLNVERRLIDRHGAVSREVVESMVKGVCRLMHTSCGIATSGIAGPFGGTTEKPVGTVWFAVKYHDHIYSECMHFTGTRNEVIESASNHGMMMLLKVLRNSYTAPYDYAGDE